MNYIELSCDGVDWIDLAKDTDRWKAVMDTVMNIRVPYNLGNFLNRSETLSFSRSTLLRGVAQYRDISCPIVYFFRHLPLLAFILWRYHACLILKIASLKAFDCLVVSRIQYRKSSDFSLASEINVLNTTQKPSVHIAHCNAIYMCAYRVCQTFPNSIYFLLVSCLLLLFVQRFRFHYFGRFSRLVSPLRYSGNVTEGGWS